MGLIKSNNLPAAGATFAFTDIEQQAQAVLMRAAQQAERMLAEAQQQADALRTRAVAEGKAAGLAAGNKEGYAKGLAQGVAEGKASATKELTPKFAAAIATFESAAAAISTHVDSFSDSTADEMLALVLAIARRVVRTIADRDIAVVEATVREAVRLAMSKASLRIGVHPDQRAELDPLLAELKMTWPSIQHVEFVDDKAVSKGGCRVFTVAGEIDADIDRQLERLIAELSPTGEAA